MKDLKQLVAKALCELVETMSEQEIYQSLEVPKNKQWGDYAFACFKLAKEFKKAPQMIAEELALKLRESASHTAQFEECGAMGGYVNVTFKKSAFADVVLEEFKERAEEYGFKDTGEGKTVIVEFSSTNIAKPFHIGHLRSTVIGNSLNRIYRFRGYHTVSVNHLGDYGTQFGKLIVAYRLWGDKERIEADPIRELLKIYVKFHEEAVNNPALEDEARAMFKSLEEGEEEITALWQWIKDVSLVEFRRVYDILGVEFDSWNGEAFYSDKMGIVLDILRTKQIVQKSEGAEIVNLDAYRMPPALITKKDGSTIYMTRDLAAAIYRKNTYDFYKNIYVVAYQQDLHFKQWFKVLELMGFDWAKDCIHVNFGMISLPDGAVKTRTGNVVFLEDVLHHSVQKVKEVIEEKNPTLENKDEVAKKVGVGAIIFQDLFNLRIKDYVFDWEKALTFEGESGPYVQYTHARACTLIEKSGWTPDFNVNSALLGDEASVDLAKVLMNFSDAIDEALEQNEPSKITRYSVQLAQAFNKFYQENQINSLEDLELKKARLALVHVTRSVIKKALYLIGIDAPEKM